MSYGALCRDLFSGSLPEHAHFEGDHLHKTDRKFLSPRYAQYLATIRRLDRFARENYGKRVIYLAVRWLLDHRATVALWGARHPGQLQLVNEVFGWSLDAGGKAEIDRILRETITDPIGHRIGPATRPSVSALEAAQ